MRLVVIEIAASLIASSALASIAVESMQDKIKAYCALGASAGSVAFFLRNRVYEKNDYAATLLWNLLVGIGVTPFLCQYLLPRLGIEIGFNSCVGFSLVMAMSIPWILDVLCPDLGKRLLTFVRRMSIKDLAMKWFDLIDKGNGR